MLPAGRPHVGDPGLAAGERSMSGAFIRAEPANIPLIFCIPHLL